MKRDIKDGGLFKTAIQSFFVYSLAFKYRAASIVPVYLFSAI